MPASRVDVAAVLAPKRHEKTPHDNALWRSQMARFQPIKIIRTLNDRFGQVRDEDQKAFFADKKNTRHARNVDVRFMNAFARPAAADGEEAARFFMDATPEAKRRRLTGGDSEGNTGLIAELGLAYVSTPPLGGCKGCGEDAHAPESEEEARCFKAREAGLECVYPMCTKPAALWHSVEACPALHSKCGRCGLRGHCDDDDDKYHLYELGAVFEAYADHGKYTRTRHEDLAWGVYHVVSEEAKEILADMGYATYARLLAEDPHDALRIVARANASAANLRKAQGKRRIQPPRPRIREFYADKREKRRAVDKLAALYEQQRKKLDRFQWRWGLPELSEWEGAEYDGYQTAPTSSPATGFRRGNRLSLAAYTARSAARFLAKPMKGRVATLAGPLPKAITDEFEGVPI